MYKIKYVRILCFIIRIPDLWKHGRLKAMLRCEAGFSAEPTDVSRHLRTAPSWRSPLQRWWVTALHWIWWQCFSHASLIIWHSKERKCRCEPNVTFMNIAVTMAATVMFTLEITFVVVQSHPLGLNFCHMHPPQPSQSLLLHILFIQHQVSVVLPLRRQRERANITVNWRRHVLTVFSSLPTEEASITQLIRQHHLIVFIQSLIHSL